MRSLQGAVQGMGGLQPRDHIVPPICYDTCNSLFLEAERVGKTPRLCAPDSIFRQYYRACKACIEIQTTDGSKEDITDALNFLNEYIQHCFEVQGTASIIGTPSLVENTVTILSTLQNTSSPTPHISEVTASNPIATTKSEGTQSNRAWVAGPVIGGVAGIVILFFVSWLLFRAKKNKDSKRNGHELHEESALKSELEVKLKPQELEAKPRPQELDAQEHNRQPVELPDNNS
ncbi:hypothetical protein CIB48_g7718 [Xylaria polymorpha]|nr:hypothetical protein CIB48_g7718 [Xylaria polymorpha]